MVKRILLGMVLLLLMVTVGCCQEPEKPLQLTIKADKEVYEVGEEIKLTAILKNQSEKEMIVFWNNEKPVLVSDKFNVVTAYIPASPVKNVETIYIKPDKAIKKDISIKNTLKPRGFKYYLTLQYNFPNIELGFETSPNQEIFDQSLTSNTITIKVVEKR